MAFDTSIYSQIKPVELPNPLAQAAKFAQLQGAQNQNRLADLLFGEKQREIADAARLNELFAGSVNPDGTINRNKLVSSVASGGLGSKLPGLQKQFADLDKEQAALKKTQAETGKITMEAANLALKQNRDLLSGVESPQQAAAWVRATHADPVLGRIVGRVGSVDEALSRIPTDPAQFAQWKMKNMLGAEEMLKYTTPDANTVANNRQSDTNNRRTVAESARGHDLADARAKDANNINKEAARTQVVETPSGFALVDKGTAQSRPVVAAGGQQVQQKDSPQYQAQKLQSQLSEGIKMARTLLPKATASGAGAMVDSAAGFFGKSTAGADAASQLDTLAGWMTANVPRMQGPQSDRDVILYKQMAAAVGDRTKPTSQRLKALDTLEALQNKYATINGTPPTSAPATAVPAGAVKFLGFE